MPSSDFNLEQATRLLGVTTGEAALFPAAPIVAVPVWLDETRSKRTQLALISAKARSEFIVAPVLLASRDLSPVPLAIFSGYRLDVDPGRGLVDECDFILATAPAVLPLRAPMAPIVAAKQNDSEIGLGQWLAQLVAAALFDEAAGRPGPVFGCVTTGEVWQFLRLVGAAAVIDAQRYDVDDLAGILAAFQVMIAQSRAAAPAS